MKLNVYIYCIFITMTKKHILVLISLCIIFLKAKYIFFVIL